MGIKDVERGGGDSTDEKAQYAKIVFAIVAYATCSSMMLIINKLAVTFLPAPSVVLFAQLLTSAVAIKGESMDPFTEPPRQVNPPPPPMTRASVLSITQPLTTAVLSETKRLLTETAAWV